jgi:uncharacterized protein YjdB
MQSVSMQYNETRPVTANGLDSGNQPTGNPPNPLNWVSSDPTVVSLTGAGTFNNVSMNLVAHTPGSATVTVTGSVNGSPYGDQFTVTVTAGVPTHFNFVFGPAVPQ